MIDRNEMVVEQLLRENIRKAIRIIKSRHIKSEEYMRTIIRNILSEAVNRKYEFTSLNLLAHFIKETVGDPDNPEGSPAFKESYTDLTSSREDREMFVEEILKLANIDFETIDEDKEPLSLGQDFLEKGFVADEELEDEELEDEDEVIKVSIDDLELAGGDIAPEEEEEEEDIFTLGEGEAEEDIPASGIEAYSRVAYKSFGTNLRRYYKQVPKDSFINKSVIIDQHEYSKGELSERDLFRIYFRKNLVLWADRYESLNFEENPVNVNIDPDLAQNTDLDDESQQEFASEETGDALDL